MLQFRTHGIKDGKHEISLQCNASEINDLPEEFFGEVQVKGILTKIGKRYTFLGTAKCAAKMICDISLEEFTEIISKDVEFSITANTELFFLNKERGTFAGEGEEIIIHEDEQEIDISEQIRQELMLSLPMKRLSPAYKDKTLEEIYPDLTDKNSQTSEIDERWKGLENLKLDK